jgi:hypothetical protein
MPAVAGRRIDVTSKSHPLPQTVLTTHKHPEMPNESAPPPDQLHEEDALLILSRRDLPQAAIASLTKQERLLGYYRVKVALVSHPNTPRTVSLALLRHLYLEDLVKVALTPGAPGDLRRVAEDAVINRLPGLALGERISLARRATGRVAGALLGDREIRVVTAALSCPKLTDELVVKALSMENISVDAVERIAGHERWSNAYSVRLALLRQPLTTLGCVLALAPQVKRNDLMDIAGDPRMPVGRRKYLTRLAASKGRPAP